MKIYVLTLVLVFWIDDSSSQSIRNDIEVFNSYDLRLAQNSRHLMIHYLESDSSRNKIHELYRFSVDSLNSKYRTFTLYENWVFMYLLNDFKNLNTLLSIEEEISTGYVMSCGVGGMYSINKNDDLHIRLSEALTTQYFQIEKNIDQFEDPGKREFLRITLTHLTELGKIDYQISDSLNRETRGYNEKYKQSPYGKWLLKNVNNENETLWRNDIYGGIGYNGLTDSLSYYFGNTMCFVFGGNVSYKKVNLGADMSLTTADMKNTIMIDNTSWGKGLSYLNATIHGNVGYHVVDMPRLIITPQIGIGYSGYSPTRKAEEKAPTIKGIEFNSIAYSGGIMVDFGLEKRRSTGL